MAIDPISGGAYYQKAAVSTKPEIAVAQANTVNIKLDQQPSSKKSTESESGQQKGKDSHPNENHIKSAISQANNKIKGHRTRCEFSYHEATKRVSIKVMDKDTEEVLREIPPEETLEMIEKMWELAGILIDEKR